MDERAADDKNYYYDLIGVSKTASEDEIRKAYRKTALENHPDKGCDLEKFLEIRHAYEVLSEAEYRKLYDEYGEDGVNMIDDSNAHYQEAIDTWQSLIQANCPDDNQVEEDTIIICDPNQATPPLPSPPPSTAIKRPKLNQYSSTPLVQPHESWTWRNLTKVMKELPAAEDSPEGHGEVNWSEIVNADGRLDCNLVYNVFRTKGSFSHCDSLLWNRLQSRRWSFVTWLAINDRLYTVARLFSWGVSGTASCIL